MSQPADTNRQIAANVKLGKDVRIFGFTNLYGCEIGDESKIGTFVEIQKGARIGRRCKISSHTFICEGVTIEDEVFIGHGVMFTNDLFPRATTDDGRPQGPADWKWKPPGLDIGRRSDPMQRSCVESPSERGRLSALVPL